VRFSIIAKSAAAVAGLLAALFLSQSAGAQDQPRLVLQITVDQLRGDLPTRYYDRLGDGGFRYLLENGVVYRNAHHAHANTETIVGHTTLATGAHPAGHGRGAAAGGPGPLIVRSRGNVATTVTILATFAMYKNNSNHKQGDFK
jgi:hypothetical protein